jgi:hypothetical protein
MECYWNLDELCDTFAEKASQWVKMGLLAKCDGTYEEKKLHCLAAMH